MSSKPAVFIIIFNCVRFFIYLLLILIFLNLFFGQNISQIEKRTGHLYHMFSYVLVYISAYSYIFESNIVIYSVSFMDQSRILQTQKKKQVR